jgi:hypothetical protein
MMDEVNMNRNQSLLRILIIATALSPASSLEAQTSPHVDPAISGIAARIAQPLQESHSTRVIVADLTGPEGEIHPAGKWLADQLSECLSRDFPALEVLNRPRERPISYEGRAKDRFDAAETAAKDWARSLGADVVITGSFAEIPTGIAVALVAMHASGSHGPVSRG